MHRTANTTSSSAPALIAAQQMPRKVKLASRASCQPTVRRPARVCERESEGNGAAYGATTMGRRASIEGR